MVGPVNGGSRPRFPKHVSHAGGPAPIGYLDADRGSGHSSAAEGKTPSRKKAEALQHRRLLFFELDDRLVGRSPASGTPLGRGRRSREDSDHLAVQRGISAKHCRGVARRTRRP